MGGLSLSDPSSRVSEVLAVLTQSKRAVPNDSTIPQLLVASHLLSNGRLKKK